MNKKYAIGWLCLSLLAIQISVQAASPLLEKCSAGVSRISGLFTKENLSYIAEAAKTTTLVLAALATIIGVTWKAKQLYNDYREAGNLKPEIPRLKDFVGKLPQEVQNFLTLMSKVQPIAGKDLKDQSEQKQQDHAISIAERPEGMLLYGPTGTGKTEIAKRIAAELGVPFFRITCSDFIQDPWKVKGVFDAARYYASYHKGWFSYMGELWRRFILRPLMGVDADVNNWPGIASTRRIDAIIFIDELESIGPRINSKGKQSNKKNLEVMAQLLAELSHESNNTIFVVGATNYFDWIDTALKTRLNEHVEVDLPKKSMREKILRHFVLKYRLSEELVQQDEYKNEYKNNPNTIVSLPDHIDDEYDLSEDDDALVKILAKKTHGFSPAKLRDTIRKVLNVQELGKQVSDNENSDTSSSEDNTNEQSEDIAEAIKIVNKMKEIKEINQGKEKLNTNKKIKFKKKDFRHEKIKSWEDKEANLYYQSN